MRLAILSVITLVCLLCLSAYAEQLSFDGGSLSIIWSADNQHVVIELTTETHATADQSPVWILTVYGHRFIDGIFAWQIHYSTDIDSVLVLPNDFLTARNFTTTQLGIEAELSEIGNELSLRLPISGLIPNLIAVGDLIEVHALWVQQEPLLSIALPAPEALAVLPADEGTTVASQVEVDLPVGGGAAIADSDVSLVSADLIPRANRFVQGTPISHQFALQEASAELPRVVLSYTLMRLHDEGTRELARFAHVSYDFDTTLYSYTIDTTALNPGSYVLLINSSNSTLAAQTPLEIIAPDS